MSDDRALPAATNFIREIINDDLRTGRHGKRVVTRFPPEPNGYLHLGHAKSICLNFGIAEDYAEVADTRCHLRFDDTNPDTESEEYAEAIKDAVQWLGYDWGEHCYHAADYFEQFYDFAVQLVKQGDAYVDSQTEEEIRENRGTVNAPGTPSPYRDRSVEENLDLLQRMRDGEFDDGEHVLRAKIDMASPHMIMRDPLLFRIKHAHHYRRGDDWCLYPMYDFAHPLEDAIEDVTHSLCTLEFDNNRRVYDWLLEHCLPEEEHESRPHQYEFSRLNVGYTVMSKRKLLQLVERGDVAGWDDPRLPTLAGLRRRGVPPAAIRAFCDDVGVTRTESRVQISRFEHAIRDTLNTTAPRVMAVVDPLKVVLTNYAADDDTEWMDLPSWPHDIDNEGRRRVPFSRTLYIERDDFQEEPEEGFRRLAPGRAVRLRNSYVITCERVVRDEEGAITELHCTYDPATKGNVDPVDSPTPQGVIHWVDAQAGIPFEARLYDRLFTVPAPDGGDEDFKTHLNPDSLQVHEGIVEPSILDNPDDQRYQFERVGYFWQDPEDSTRDALVFNQIVPLRDRWANDDETVDLEAERKAKEAAKRKQRERSIAAQRDPAEQLSEAERAVYEQYHRELGLTRDGAALLAGDEPLRTFFRRALDHYDAPQAVANWIVNELQAARKDQSLIDLPFDAAQFADLVRLVDTEVITNRAARDIFGRMMAEGGDPAAIVEEEGLQQIDDAGALRKAAQQVVADNPDEAARFRNGEQQLMGFFMGQIMRATNGSADPQEAQAALREVLSNA